MQPGGVLRATLFAEPQLSFEGAPFAFRAPARAFSLLAYLLLNRERPLARDTIAFSFWPDLDEVEARTKLRTHLHYVASSGLPHVDGPPWILADKRTIQWNPKADVWVDVDEFERLASDASTQSRAVELYAGDLLSTLDDEWIAAPRARLRDRQLDLLLRLLHGANGDPAGAIAYAQRLLAMDPWREDAIRALIAARSATGDRAGGIQTYREFAQRLMDELGVTPSPETTAAYEPLTSASAAPARDNLPVYITSFVGRETEIAALHAALADSRFVTLTGAGGVGKTRLAIEASHGLLDRFSDGVWLVELGALADEELIVPAIAGAFGLQHRSETALTAHLRDRSALVLLDNCEHLPAVARIAEQLVLSCPGVRVFATSREPLGVTGERIERLAPLQVASAVRMFLDRAADVAPASAMRGEEAASTAAAICKRLDGIPLAIELAAARTRSMSLALLAERLENRFAVLTGGSRTALRRHQTMLATLDWSFEALALDERAVFARMGTFVGGWTLEAAAAVCDDLEFDKWGVQDRLTSLVDKSLVLADYSGPDVRYGILETMRTYALEKLADSAQGDSASRRHARYFAVLGQDVPTPERTLRSAGMRDGAWFKRMKPELENVRAAMTWAIGGLHDCELGARIASAFAWFAHREELMIEAVRWCDAVLAELGPEPDPALEASIQLGLAVCWAGLSRRELAIPFARRAMELFDRIGDRVQFDQAARIVAEQLAKVGRRDEALPLAEEALQAARAGGRTSMIANALIAKAVATNESDARRAVLEETLRVCREGADRFGLRSALMLLGEDAFAAGDAPAALEFATKCIDSLLEDSESQAFLVVARCNAAAYALAVGAIDAASAFARTALVMSHDIGDRRRLAFALQYLAAVDLARGDAGHAAQLIGAADACLEATATNRSFTEQSTYERTLERLHECLSDGELYALQRQGRRWTGRQAVDEASSTR